MPHAIALGAQVVDVVGVSLDLEAHSLGDGQTVTLETGSLGRVVGEQSHGPDTEVIQDLCPCAVVTGIRRHAQGEVGIDGVVSLVLQRV